MNRDEQVERITSMSAYERLELGQAIGRLREFLGKSQRELYEHESFGLAKSTYAAIERTGSGQPAHVVTTLELLGTDLERILSWYRTAREALDRAVGKGA